MGDVRNAGTLVQLIVIKVLGICGLFDGGEIIHCLNLKYDEGMSAKYGVVGSTGNVNEKIVNECGYETGSCTSGAGVEDFAENITEKTEGEFENLREEWK